MPAPATVTVQRREHSHEDGIELPPHSAHRSSGGEFSPGAPVRTPLTCIAMAASAAPTAGIRILGLKREEVGRRRLHRCGGFGWRPGGRSSRRGRPRAAAGGAGAGPGPGGVLTPRGRAPRTRRVLPGSSPRFVHRMRERTKALLAWSVRFCALGTALERHRNRPLSRTWRS